MAALSLLLAFSGCNDRYVPREGCESDSDCRGARVCDEGQCVDPAVDAVDADAGDAADGFDADVLPDVLPDVPPAEPRLEVTPRAITLPNLPLGELTIVGLGVRNAGGGALVVDDIAQTEASPQVTIRIGGLPGPLARGDEALIPVQVSGLVVGSFATELAIVSNGGDARVSVAGRVTDGTLGCALLEPDRFAFGSLEPGEPLTGIVELSNCGDLPLSLEVDGGGNVAVSWDTFVETLSPGDSVRGSFFARAPTEGGPFEFVARVGPAELGAGFRVSGTVEAPIQFCLEAVTPNINFGLIDVGSERTRTALVRNCGTADLDVIPRVPLSDVFSTQERAFTVQAGNTVEFSTFFEPPAAADYEATMSVEQVGGFATALFALTGTGAEDVGPVPCIEELPPFLEFGEVRVGDVLERQVRVRNCGDVPLTPQSLSVPFDSGFVATFDAEVIPPGTNFFVNVVFNPPFAGSFDAELRVSFDPAVVATFQLSGEATPTTVGPVIEIESTDIVFGTVQMGQFADRDVRVCNVGDETLTLAIAPSVRLPFTAVSLGEDTLEPMQCTVLTIRFRPMGLAPGEAQTFTGTVRLDTNAVSGADAVNATGVGIGGDISEPCLELVASPDRLTVLAGEEAVVRVELSNCGTVPLVIEDVALGLDAPFPASFQVDAILTGDDLTLDVGESGAILVSFGATRAGRYVGEVFVVTDALGDSVATITFDVTEEPSPDCLELSPASLNLGRVGIGEEVQRAVVATNCGTGSLTLQPSLTGPAAFQYVGANPVTLAPGSSVPLNVVFRSTSAGTFRTTLRVAAPGSDLDTIAVPVQVAVTDSTFCPDLRAGGSTSSNGPFRTSVSTLEDIDVFLDAGYPIADTSGVRFAWTLVSFEGVRPPVEASTATNGRIRLSETLQGVYQYEVTYVSDDGCVGADTVELTVEPDTGVGEGIRIVISWRTPGDADELTDPGTDVDLHFARRDSSLRTAWNDDDDCYFGNREADWGVPRESIDNGRLLRDEVDGIGPEIIVLEQPTRGERYLVAVHYFSDDSLGPSDVTLRIFRNGIQRETATRRLERTGDVWLAAEIRDLGETIELLGLNNFRGFPPAAQPLP